MTLKRMPTGVLLRDRRSLSRSICSDASAFSLDVGVAAGDVSFEALSEDTELARDRWTRDVDGAACESTGFDGASSGRKPKVVWLSDGDETLWDSLEGFRGLVLGPAAIPRLKAEMRSCSLRAASGSEND